MIVVGGESPGVLAELPPPPLDVDDLNRPGSDGGLVCSGTTGVTRRSFGARFSISVASVTHSRMRDQNDSIIELS